MLYSWRWYFHHAPVNIALQVRKIIFLGQITINQPELKTIKPMIKQISIQEYTEKINPQLFRANRKYPDRPITHSAVKYRINNGLPLPEVIKYKKVGRIHILSVDVKF